MRKMTINFVSLGNFFATLLVLTLATRVQTCRHAFRKKQLCLSRIYKDKQLETQKLRESAGAVLDHRWILCCTVFYVCVNKTPPVSLQIIIKLYFLDRLACGQFGQQTNDCNKIYLDVTKQCMRMKISLFISCHGTV